MGGDSSLPVGFDGVTFGDPPNYKNIALNLFPYRDTLYAGIVTQYVPEYGITDLQGAVSGRVKTVQPGVGNRQQLR